MANELQAISVILVFIVVALGLLIPPARDELNLALKNFTSLGAEENCKARVRTLWLFRFLPLLCLCALVAYLILPRALSIMAESQFAIWRFDLLPTLFVLIDALLWVSVIAVGYMFFKLWDRKRKMDKHFAGLKR